LRSPLITFQWLITDHYEPLHDQHLLSSLIVESSIEPQ
jgi:hypothetical protein